MRALQSERHEVAAIIVGRCERRYLNPQHLTSYQNPREGTHGGLGRPNQKADRRSGSLNFLSLGGKAMLRCRWNGQAAHSSWWSNWRSLRPGPAEKSGQTCAKATVKNGKEAVMDPPSLRVILD
jgi:hypothetical protein